MIIETERHLNSKAAYGRLLNSSTLSPVKVQLS